MNVLDSMNILGFVNALKRIIRRDQETATNIGNLNFAAPSQNNFMSKQKEHRIFESVGSDVGGHTINNEEECEDEDCNNRRGRR